MKRRILFLFTAFAVLMAVSCSRYNYNQYSTKEYSRPATAKFIRLDSSYQLYYRAVKTEVQAVPESERPQKVLSLHQGGAAANGVGTGGGKIIEIEYLWVSKSQCMVIYVSTVADRYQKRYSTPGFLGLNLPNAADFRVFLIGMVNSDDENHFTFYFKDGKHTDNWLIGYNGDNITLIQDVEKRFAAIQQVIPFNQALSHQLEFTKIENWQLKYLNRDSKDPNEQEGLQTGGIYYTTENHKCSLIIPFSNTTLVFGNKYVIYDPAKAISLTTP